MVKIMHKQTKNVIEVPEEHWKMVLRDQRKYELMEPLSEQPVEEDDVPVDGLIKEVKSQDTKRRK